MTKELVQKVRKHNGKQWLMLMKIDIKIAYHSLKWSFIGKALQMLSFSQKVRRFIMSYLTSVEYNIMLNGSRAGYIKPTRDLR